MPHVQNSLELSIWLSQKLGEQYRVTPTHFCLTIQTTTRGLFMWCHTVPSCTPCLLADYSVTACSSQMENQSIHLG